MSYVRVRDACAWATAWSSTHNASGRVGMRLDGAQQSMKIAQKCRFGALPKRVDSTVDVADRVVCTTIFARASTRQPRKPTGYDLVGGPTRRDESRRGSQEWPRHIGRRSHRFSWSSVGRRGP